jgi:hypothetical protein
MFGAQEKNELHHFIVRKRVAERGHFLTAILNLIGDLGRTHRLANTRQGRSFGGTGGSVSMAVGTPFFAEKDSPRMLRVFLAGRGLEGKCLKNQDEDADSSGKNLR